MFGLHSSSVSELAPGPDDLEQPEPAGLDLFDGGPHVDGHHRLAADYDLVSLATDGAEPHVGATTWTRLAVELDEVVGAVAYEGSDEVAERGRDQLTALAPRCHRCGVAVVVRKRVDALDERGVLPDVHAVTR